jgi:hypothetical protein
MKKHATSSRTLNLGRETVRQLSSLAMQHAHGGGAFSGVNCTPPTGVECVTHKCPVQE